MLLKMAVFYSFMVVQYSTVCLWYIYHIFHIHSSADRHRYSHVLAIINGAAMDTGVHVSFEWEFSSFPTICPGVGLLDHMVTLFFVFKEPPYCLPWWPQLICSFISAFHLYSYLINILFSTGCELGTRGGRQVLKAMLKMW